MRALFVHKNFPAQFGHIASRLAQEHGWQCTFVSERPPVSAGGVDNIQYRLRGGATEKTHYCSRTFENGIWHAAGVFDALQPVTSMVKPDVIVGHSGFGSTLFLKELFPDTPIVGYFEWFYRPRGTDLDFRPDVPAHAIDVLRSRARNAMILLDMEYSAAGYTPTEFQHSLMPEADKPKLRVLHDGIDTRFWRRHDVPDRKLGNLELGENTRLVTYVSRGLESMRGFDIFMRAAKKIYTAYPDVKIVVVGEDRVAYGGDLARIKGDSFRDHVLAQDEYDPDKIRFAGRVEPAMLARLLSLSDLHVYLTVPFVLSWSVFNAMACEATILASDTAPVREVIKDGETGLLCDFFDADAFAAKAVEVLEQPEPFRDLGRSARRLVEERYSLGVILPQMKSFYEEVARAGTA